MVRALAFHQCVPGPIPGPGVIYGLSFLVLYSGARFSKAPESFRARKAIFRSSVSKNEEVYTPETSCITGKLDPFTDLMKCL